MAAVLGVCSADAADLAYQPAVKAPIATAAESWTGWYGGVNLGGTWNGHQTVDTVSTAFPTAAGALPVNLADAAAAAATTSIPVKSDRFIGGGQLGWNFQFDRGWVAGLEADIQGVAGGGTGSAVTVVPLALAPVFNYQMTTTVTKRLDYLGTVRGRLGFLATPALLVYGTGGLAYGRVSTSTDLFSLTPAVTNGPIGASSSFAGTLAGWTAGGGFEWMFLRSWSAKAEYLYYDLGSHSSNFTLVQPHGGLVAFVNPVQSSTRFDGHIVRLGVNWHFN
ncbi:outer membrane beta-barrel protein [Bradyrhizobium sp. NAS80.1]|uniref:outer membrane protein n=1 Tax=Bradyrhizobium sp. NAS80.1 TaxID=1680159 RepID=UPI00143CE261|nr:outer membrane beta-barrel protein [Bradyrhizobium sp. NAS80.1]